MVGLALSLLGLSGAIYVLPGSPPPLEPPEDTTATSTLTYSDSAARRYEPEAFQDGEEADDSLFSSSTAAPASFDKFCQWSCIQNHVHVHVKVTIAYSKSLSTLNPKPYIQARIYSVEYIKCIKV